MTIVADQALFGFWFQLQAKAAEKNWAVVRDLLVQNPDHVLPRHNLNDLTFKSAVDKGHLDIVETFMSRGYVPDAKYLTTMLRLISVDMRNNKREGGAAQVADWLAAIPAGERVPLLDEVVTGLLPNDDLFDHVFPLIAPAIGDGFDPWRGGAVLQTVVEQGANKKLVAMFKAGLDPYEASVMDVFSRLGRDKNATANQRAQIGIWMNYCWNHPVTDPAMGRFEKLKQSDKRWRDVDFLAPLTRKPSPRLIDVIAVRGGNKELQEVFQQSRWPNNFAEMERVYSVAKTRNGVNSIDMAVIHAQFTRASLGARARPRVVFSGPKGPKP